MKKFVVSTNTSYDILIGKDIMKDAGKLIRKKLEPCRASIVTDMTVNSIYAQVLVTSLIEAGFQVSKIVFPSGEHSKNLTTYGNILEALADEGLTRTDVIIALGGGVVGDLSGFAAATYMRGIKYIQVPTTYIAAIDASVGGKTGINLLSGKNLAGAFWQPSMVICDYKTFDTLPSEKILDGAAEAIKHGVVSDERLIEKVLQGDYEYVIERCVSIKKSIVEADERDLGLRQLLNFGHTIGHGIEKLSSYSISHGHAVAKGMVAEARAAEAMDLTPKGVSKALSDILERAGFDLSIPFSPDDIYKFALLDKKISGDKISIVAPDSIGKCHLHKISVPELKKFIQLGLEK